MLCLLEPKKKVSSLSYYFAETKDRLVFTLLSLGLTISLCYIYSIELIFLYVKPFLGFEKPFIFTELTEAFYITLKICTASGLYIMLPFVCYQGWCFFVPSCYCHERRKWTTVLMLSNALAVLGWVVVYFIVLPKLSAILLQFEIKKLFLTIQLEARISSYIMWSLQVFFIVGAACQLPLASYLAFQAGVFDPKTLSKNRRVVFLGSMIMAALLSPPDLLTQLVTTVFLFFCFELILWLGMIFKQGVAG
jgi:sec-independent protein translocase protein TatC